MSTNEQKTNNNSAKINKTKILMQQ